MPDASASGAAIGDHQVHLQCNETSRLDGYRYAEILRYAQDDGEPTAHNFRGVILNPVFLSLRQGYTVRFLPCDFQTEPVETINDFAGAAKGCFHVGRNVIGANMVHKFRLFQ